FQIQPQNTIVAGIGNEELALVFTQRKAVGAEGREARRRQEAVMFHKVHRAGRRALVCIVNPKDRSLERVRYIKVTMTVKSETVRGWGVIAKDDRVLPSVRVAYGSVGRQSYNIIIWDESNVLNGRRVVEIGRYTLNLRYFSH